MTHNRSCSPTRIIVFLALTLATSYLVEAKTGSPSEPFAPGSADAFLEVAGPCPSFSWVTRERAVAERLVVYRIGGEGGHLAESEEVLTVSLPPGATTWTPSTDRCLPPGRYGWTVVSEREAGIEVLFFSVPELPSRAELLQQMRRIEARLEGATVPGTDGQETANSSRPALRLPAAATPGSNEDKGTPAHSHSGSLTTGSTPSVAIRGELADSSGETYGLSGVVSSPDGAGVRAENTAGSGADLVLVGSGPWARLTEEGLLRTSDGDVAFEVGNPGSGSMTLRVDGIDVVTTATDQDTQYQAGDEIVIDGTTIHVDEGTGSGLDADLLDGMDSTDFLTVGSESWVDEAGDTMTGPLVVDVSSGFALQTGSGDPIDVGGGFYENGTRLLEGGGGSNLAVGLGSLLGNTTGIGNTAVGDSALGSNTEGVANTGVGASALLFNQTAKDQTAVGFEALRQSVADWNTAVGSLALRNTTLGHGNTAVGASALESNSDGIWNTALGINSLQSNTIGESNTAVGVQAMLSNVDGDGNTAVGNWALLHNQSGTYNVAVGDSAMFDTDSAHDNVAVGTSALQAVSTGSDNVAIGPLALAQLDSGDGNIAIGPSAGVHSFEASGSIFIGNDASASPSNPIGEIRIGQDSIHSATYIAGIAGSQVIGEPVYVDPDGRLGLQVTLSPSKEGIRPVGDVSRRLLELRPVSFRYTEEVPGRGDPPREYGLLAEEVAEVFPELVLVDGEGRPQGIRYQLLSSLLLAELQRTDERLAAVEEHLEATSCSGTSDQQ